MNIWLPKPLYKLKPLLYIICAILMLNTIPNLFVIMFSSALIGYSVWICWMRYQWGTFY